MKPKEYIKKYRLDVQSKFSHNEFVFDLTNDFSSMIEYFSSLKTWNFKMFQNVVSMVRQKWDVISLKACHPLPETLWKYFYASVVCHYKDELFNDYLKEQKRKREREERERKKWEKQANDYFESFFHNFFRRTIFDMLAGLTIPPPIDAFNKLGFKNHNGITEGMVKTNYRMLVKKHHPDVGGNQKEFIEITEAKNKCIAFLETQ